MKNFRLKLLLLTVGVSTVLSVLGWIQNLDNIDFFSTKNNHASAVLKIEIMKSSDSTFLKTTALDLLESLDQRRRDDDKTARSAESYLIWNVVASIFTIVLVFIELWKRRHAR